MEKITKLQFEWFDYLDEGMLLLDEDTTLKMIPIVKNLYLKKRLKKNEYRKLRNQFNHKKPIRVKSLKKILTLNNLRFSDFNPKVNAFVGNRYTYPISLPLNLDRTESAILVAAFMSDGNNNPNHPFYANQGFLGDKITKNVRSIMPSIAFEERDDNVRFHAILSLILTKLGVPVGNKTKLNPKIPEFILKNKTYSKAYLTQVFDDEGHATTRESRKIVLGRSVAVNSLPEDFTKTLAYTKKNYYNSLPEPIKEIVKVQPPNLLLMEYDLLNEWGIKPSMRCRGLTKYLETISADWVIEIAGIENINKFHTDIGFSQPEKIQQMKDYLNTCRKDKNFMRICTK